MNETHKIHLLSRELIPILNDIEPETKEIVLEHIALCSSCQALYENAHELDRAFLEEKDKPTQPKEVQPLKKLVQFNRGIKLLLIMIRVAILSYAGYTALALADFIVSADVYFDIQATIYFFYLPASVFLLVFTFVFLNKRWFMYSIGADVFVIFGLNIIYKLFQLLL